MESKRKDRPEELGFPFAGDDSVLSGGTVELSGKLLGSVLELGNWLDVGGNDDDGKLNGTLLIVGRTDADGTTDGR